MYFLGIIVDILFGIILLSIGSIVLVVGIFWEKTSTLVRAFCVFLAGLSIFSGEKLVTLDFPLGGSLVRVDVVGVILGVLMCLISGVLLWYSLWVIDKKTPQRMLGYGLSAIFAVSSVMLMTRGYLQSIFFTIVVLASLLLFVFGLVFSYVKPTHKYWGQILNFLGGC